MSGMVKSERQTSAATCSSSVPPTSEERDLDEWARRLVSRPTPQLGNSAGGQQGTLNSFLNIPTTQTVVGVDGLPQHNGYNKINYIHL